MEIDHLKSIWQRGVQPAYSGEEIEQIFVLRTKRTFGKLQNLLLKDTLTALFVTAGFVAVLFYFELESRLYWTIGLMGLALINVVIFSMQAQLLNRSLLYKKDILTSLKSTRSRLGYLQWFYLIWPTLLAGVLNVAYQLSYPVGHSSVQIVLQTTLIMIVVAIISYAISYLSIKKYQKLVADFIDQLEQEGSIKI